jgi:trigger factor
MQVHVEKLSPVLVEFQIQVPAETVLTELEKSYQELMRTARVRGFRKGKAPKHVIRQLYGRAVHADVAQRLMDRSLQTALTEREIQPLTQPSVEPTELKAKEAFSFKARFEVRPEISKVEWEKLDARRPKVEVDDKRVDDEIEGLRREHATVEPVEGRAAQAGDTATLSLSFQIEGKDQQEELDAELGAGQILGFLDEAVVGMKAGEHKDVEGAFPKTHPMSKLRGKMTNFHIDVKELKQRVLPKVDDEFAKDCEHENLEALRSALREKLATRMKQQADEDVARQLVAKLCDKNPIPVPPSLVDQQARVSERELRMMARMTGQTLDESTLGQQIRADAEMKVRAGLLMAEIAKEKQVKVTEEDMEKGYAELAEQSGKNVAKVKAEYREKQKRDMLVGMILEDKVLDLLEKAAKISEES